MFTNSISRMCRRLLYLTFAIDVESTDRRGICEMMWLGVGDGVPQATAAITLETQKIS